MNLWRRPAEGEKEGSGGEKREEKGRATVPVETTSAVKEFEKKRCGSVPVHFDRD